MNLFFAIFSLPLAILMWIMAYVFYQDDEKGVSAWYNFLGFFNFLAWVLNVLVVTGAFE